MGASYLASTILLDVSLAPSLVAVLHTFCRATANIYAVNGTFQANIEHLPVTVPRNASSSRAL